MMKRDNDIDKKGINDIIHLLQKILRVFYIIVVIGIILGILIGMQKLNLFKLFNGVFKVLSPIIIGFVFAWLFYPLHRKLLDKGLNKVFSATIVFLTAIGITTIFIYIFIPIIYKQVNDLISMVPSILSSTTEFVTKTFDKFDIPGIDTASIKDKLITAGEEMIINFTSSLPNNILNFVKNIISALGIIMISLVVGLYMLIDYEDLTVRFHSLLKRKNREEFQHLFENISMNARKVVNGTFLVASLVFVCDTIGFSIVGLDMAILFGLFCGLTDLIPYIGPYIGGLAAIIVGFTEGPLVGILTLIVAIIVQLLENYVIQPVVMSKAMDLHPITIIGGLLLFGYLFNVIGMIVATPCMAIIKEIIIFINRKYTVVDE